MPCKLCFFTIYVRSAAGILLRLPFILGLVVPALFTNVNAQTIEEVIVTAQKRAESMQDISVSVTAFNQDSLDRQGVGDIWDIVNKVPTMNLQAPNGVVWGFMRGTGNSNPTAGGDSSLTFHYDGIYMTFPTAALVDMWDVERVEILRGPQGTLYGRNATGGSINIIPKRPTDELDMAADITAGSDSLIRFRGAFNPPKTGALSTRIAASYINRDGYQNNLEPGFDNTDEDDSWMVRIMSGLELGDRGELLVTLLGAETNAAVSSPLRFGDSYSGLYGRFISNPKPTDPRTSRKDVVEENKFKTYGVTGNLELDFNAMTFRAIAAYYEVDRFNHSDWDGSELNHLDFIDEDNIEQTSVELQLLSNTDGRWEWIVGAYWAEMDNARLNDILVNGSLRIPLPFPPGVPPSVQVYLFGELEATSYALFGQASYDLTNRLKLTGGFRYSWDEKKNSAVNYQGPAVLYDVDNLLPPFTVYGGFDEEWDEPMGRVALDWHLSDTNMLYASVSRGYKAGGFQTNAISPMDPGAPPSTQPAAGPEFIWSYEIGAKNTFLDERLLLNAALYYAQYDDIQQMKFFPGSFAPGFFNVGDGDALGIDLEWIALVGDNLRIDGSVGYIDTEYDGSLEVDMAKCGVAPPFFCPPPASTSGNQFVATPEWSLNIGAEYGFPAPGGRLLGRIDLQHRSRTYYTLFEDAGRSQAAYEKIDVRLVYETNDGHWTAEVYGHNITDKDTVHTMFSGSSLLGSDSPVVWYAAPLTWGIRLGYRY